MDRERCPIVLTHKLCIDQPRVYQTTSCIDTVFQTLHWILQEGPQDFFVRHCTPSVYLSLHQLGSRQGLGTRLRVQAPTVLYVANIV